MSQNQTSNRFRFLLLFALTILLGLASRKYPALLPMWLAKSAGDILYATMAFWLVSFLFPRLSMSRRALAAVLFCFGIEFLKFSHLPWLVAARHSRTGALVFGVGFHTLNLACYVVGVVVAVLAEKAIGQRRT